jgi:PmbA protein
VSAATAQETPLELATRALGHADGDAQVTVVRERSLHARFARSAPTQLTDIDDLTVHVLALHDGRTGTAAKPLRPSSSRQTTFA